MLALEHSVPLTVATQGATMGTRMLLSRQAAFPLLADFGGSVLNIMGQRFLCGNNAPSSSFGMNSADSYHLSAFGQSGTFTVPTGNGNNYIVTNSSSTPPWAYGSALAPGDAFLCGVLPGQPPFTYVPSINGAGTNGSLFVQLVVNAVTSTTVTSFTGQVILDFSYWMEETSVAKLTMGPITISYSPLAGSIGGTVLGTGAQLTVPGGWYRLDGIQFINAATGTGMFQSVDAWYGGASSATVSTAVAVSTITFTVGAGTVLGPIAPPPAWSISPVPYSSTRVTAAAVLATNVTKALNKEGTVNAGRLVPAYTNLNFTINGLAALHPMERAYMGLEEGFYTYSPPSVDLDTWLDYTYVFSGAGPVVNATRPVWRLDNPAMWHCVSFNDPDGGTALALNVDWHLEFRSSSILWPISVSNLPLEALHSALLAMQQTGYFFDNVDHKRLIGIALKVASYLSPKLGLAIDIGRQAYLKYQNMQTPPATTLQVKTKKAPTQLKKKKVVVARKPPAKAAAKTKK